MSAIPDLRKKLKSVRTTEKLSKALKTVSAAKYSKLSSLFKNYSLYAKEYRKLCNTDKDTVSAENIDTVVVFGSNRGFCGGFNNDILQYLKDNVFSHYVPSHLIVCGDEMSRLLSENGFVPEQTFVFDDVPQFSEIEELYNTVAKNSEDRSDYPVMFVRSLYKNTMIQIPYSETVIFNSCNLFTENGDRLLFPDKKTVKDVIAKKLFRTVLYGAVLETALGVQAATLMTMRSAYDTATEYCETLESEIHRQRQRDVTADVIETSSENASKNEGDDSNE